MPRYRSFHAAAFGCGGYVSAYAQQSDSECRYSLKGNIVTNGLEVHLLAYDTKCPRRKAAVNADQGENPDQDLANNLDAEMEIEDGFMAVSGLDTDAKDRLQDEVASGPATLLAPSTSAVASTVSLNWRQKSKILDNLKLVLEEPEDRARLQDAIILGADPGEINALVIARLDPRKPHERHIIKITRRMHYTPHARYRQALEAQGGRRDRQGR
ncbi:hypothetical protein EC968_000165 [Mortierella alpina]|nr:hypothetical protein EC968_000165 [Mortierella alpina]